MQLPCGSYYAGDEVSLWAENDPKVVERFAQQLGIQSGELDEAFMLQRIQVCCDPSSLTRVCLTWAWGMCVYSYTANVMYGGETGVAP